MNDGQIAIKRHQNKSVDTGIGRHEDQVLNYFAPNVTKRPERQGVIRRRERHAEDDEEQIGQGQVDDEQVGSVTHLLIGSYDDHD